MGTFSEQDWGDSDERHQQTVIVSENKDTALLFPEFPDAVSIHGNGYAAASQLPHVPWLRRARTVLYWGDIDSAGYEILNNLRAAGIPAQSILMDPETYERYERYGSWTDEHGKPLAAGAPKPLAHLTKPEESLYSLLVDPAWQRVRRIEQERIPLGTAAAEAASRL